MVELTLEISEFMDKLKRPDKYTNIDYITPLMEHFGFTEKQAENIRHEYVAEIFKRMPYGDPDEQT